MKTLLLTFFSLVIAKSFFGKRDFKFLELGPFDFNLEKKSTDKYLM